MDGFWITLLWILATNEINSRLSIVYAQYSNTRGYYARMKESGYYSARSPYRFGYRFKDDFGNIQSREEKTDSNGARRGSYSFYDANGIYRRVDYVADNLGFRATVTTNEPGTHHASPANVHIQKDEPEYSTGQARLRIGQTYSQLHQIKPDETNANTPNTQKDTHYPSKYTSKSKWKSPVVVKVPSAYELSEYTPSTFRSSYPISSSVDYVSIPDLEPDLLSYPETPPLRTYTSVYSTNHDDYNQKYKATPLKLPETSDSKYTSPIRNSKYKKTGTQVSTKWPKVKQQVKYGKRLNSIVKIHVPVGIVDNPYVPIYRDK